MLQSAFSMASTRMLRWSRKSAFSSLTCTTFLLGSALSNFTLRRHSSFLRESSTSSYTSPACTATKTSCSAASAAASQAKASPVRRTSQETQEARRRESWPAVGTVRQPSTACPACASMQMQHSLQKRLSEARRVRWFISLHTNPSRDRFSSSASPSMNRMKSPRESSGTGMACRASCPEVFWLRLATTFTRSSPLLRSRQQRFSPAASEKQLAKPRASSRRDFLVVEAWMVKQQFCLASTETVYQSAAALGTMTSPTPDWMANWLLGPLLPTQTSSLRQSLLLLLVKKSSVLLGWLLRQLKQAFESFSTYFSSRLPALSVLTRCVTCSRKLLSASPYTDSSAQHSPSPHLSFRSCSGMVSVTGQKQLLGAEAQTPETLFSWSSRVGQRNFWWEERRRAQRRTALCSRFWMVAVMLSRLQTGYLKRLASPGRTDEWCASPSFSASGRLVKPAVTATNCCSSRCSSSTATSISRKHSSQLDWQQASRSAAGTSSRLELITVDHLPRVTCGSAMPCSLGFIMSTRISISPCSGISYRTQSTCFFVELRSMRRNLVLPRLADEQVRKELPVSRPTAAGLPCSFSTPMKNRPEPLKLKVKKLLTVEQVSQQFEVLMSLCVCGATTCRNSQIFSGTVLVTVSIPELLLRTSMKSTSRGCSTRWLEECSPRVRKLTGCATQSSRLQPYVSVSSKMSRTGDNRQTQYVVLLASPVKVTDPSNSYISPFTSSLDSRVSRSTRAEAPKTKVAEVPRAMWTRAKARLEASRTVKLKTRGSSASSLPCTSSFSRMAVTGLTMCQRISQASISESGRTSATTMERQRQGSSSCLVMLMLLNLQKVPTPFLCLAGRITGIPMALFVWLVLAAMALHWATSFSTQLWKVMLQLLSEPASTSKFTASSLLFVSITRQSTCVSFGCSRSLHFTFCRSTISSTSNSLSSTVQTLRALKTRVNSSEVMVELSQISSSLLLLVEPSPSRRRRSSSSVRRAAPLTRTSVRLKLKQESMFTCSRQQRLVGRAGRSRRQLLLPSAISYSTSPGRTCRRGAGEASSLLLKRQLLRSVTPQSTVSTLTSRSSSKEKRATSRSFQSGTLAASKRKGSGGISSKETAKVMALLYSSTASTSPNSSCRQSKLCGRAATSSRSRRVKLASPWRMATLSPSATARTVFTSTRTSSTTSSWNTISTTRFSSAASMRLWLRKHPCSSLWDDLHSLFVSLRAPLFFDAVERYTCTFIQNFFQGARIVTNAYHSYPASAGSRPSREKYSVMLKPGAAAEATTSVLRALGDALEDCPRRAGRSSSSRKIYFMRRQVNDSDSRYRSMLLEGRRQDHGLGAARSRICRASSSGTSAPSLSRQSPSAAPTFCAVLSIQYTWVRSSSRSSTASRRAAGRKRGQPPRHTRTTYFRRLLLFACRCRNTANFSRPISSSRSTSTRLLTCGLSMKSWMAPRNLSSKRRSRWAGGRASSASRSRNCFFQMRLESCWKRTYLWSALRGRRSSRTFSVFTTRQLRRGKRVWRRRSRSRVCCVLRAWKAGVLLRLREGCWLRRAARRNHMRSGSVFSREMRWTRGRTNIRNLSAGPQSNPSLSSHSLKSATSLPSRSLRNTQVSSLRLATLRPRSRSTSRMKLRTYSEELPSRPEGWSTTSRNWYSSFFPVSMPCSMSARTSRRKDSTHSPSARHCRTTTVPRASQPLMCLPTSALRPSGFAENQKCRISSICLPTGSSFPRSSSKASPKLFPLKYTSNGLSFPSYGPEGAEAGAEVPFKRPTICCKCWLSLESMRQTLPTPARLHSSTMGASSSPNSFSLSLLNRSQTITTNSCAGLLCSCSTSSCLVISYSSGSLSLPAQDETPEAKSTKGLARRKREKRGGRAFRASLEERRAAPSRRALLRSMQ